MPLSDLIAALAAASGASRELDERIAVEVFGWRRYEPEPRDLPHMANMMWNPLGAPVGKSVVPAYTSSLDAITGAVREKWPDVGWDVQSGGQAWIGRLSAPARYSVTARSPAIALGLAAARLAAAEAADAR